MGDIFDIVKELASQISKLELQDNNNFFTTIGLKENDHTNILATILKYGQQNERGILDSFFQIIKEECSEFKKIDYTTPEILTQKGYIDCLIKEKQYAIIIENKICDAPNQPSQIDTYVNYVNSNFNIDYKLIFVVYLTRDGKKSIDKGISDDTLYKLGKIDGDNKQASRLIALNYRDHIYPWIKQCVYPLCRINQKIFCASIIAYIDFLEQFLNIKNDNSNSLCKMKDNILEKLNITNETPSKKYTVINNFLNNINDLRDFLQEMNEEIEEKELDIFKKQATLILGKDFVFKRNLNNKYLQVFKKEWENYNIHFEWYKIDMESLFPTNDNYILTFNLHVENDDVFRKRLVDKLYKKDNCDDFVPDKMQTKRTVLQKTYKNTDLEQLIITAYSEFKVFVDDIDHIIIESKI